MKKTSYYLLLALIVSIASITFFSSCDDDDSPNLYGSIATVQPLNETSFYLLTDGGKTLYPGNNYHYKPKFNQRVIVYYNILSNRDDRYDHYISIHQIRNILTKGIIDLNTENQDSIGNDPIRILSHWIADDYLNIEFGYNSGGEEMHYINLVNNTTVAPSADGKIHLEFRHNANGDPQRNGVKGVVAFDLRPYKPEGENSVEFVVKVKDFNEEKEYTIIYKLGEIQSVNSKIDGNYTSEAS